MCVFVMFDINAVTYRGNILFDDALFVPGQKKVVWPPLPETNGYHSPQSQVNLILFVIKVWVYISSVHRTLVLLNELFA